MTPPLPHREPESCAAGETVQWQRAFADYPPADGWTVQYYFVGPDVFQIQADGSTGLYVMTLNAADTAGKPAGVYRWRAYAEQGTGSAFQRWLLAAGSLNLLPDFTAAADNELEEDVETALAAITAVLNGRITADIQAYTIAGRAVTKIPISELLTMRGLYAARLWQRQHPGESGPMHAAHFTGPRQDAPPFWNGVT